VVIIISGEFITFYIIISVAAKIVDVTLVAMEGDLTGKFPFPDIFRPAKSDRQ